MDGTRSISELLAYLLVAAMAAALALPFVVPVFRRWVRTARASRMRTAISGALLLALVYMGGSLDKQQQSTPFTPETFFGGQTSLRTEEPPSQPQWYVDLGYPATDTDGDGIPDYWERRTHTNPPSPTRAPTRTMTAWTTRRSSSTSATPSSPTPTATD